MKIIWYSVVRKDFFCHATIGQLPFLLFPLCFFFTITVIVIFIAIIILTSP